MEVFVCVIIFIMGTFFGSFFTLAVYRIPLKKDITHERSFCPNCNHRLEFLDLIPVFSYIFLGGKCRYCGQKIRIRYLFLEILSGLVFLVSFMSLNIKNIYLDINKFIYFIEFIFMYVTLILIAGIDKEYIKINKSILFFGAIMQTMYIVYLYIFESCNIHRYVIYILIFAILYILNIIMQKNNEKYILQILLLISYILLNFQIKYALIIILFALIFSFIYKIIKKIDFRKIPVRIFYINFSNFY